MSLGRAAPVPAEGRDRVAVGRYPNGARSMTVSVSLPAAGRTPCDGPSGSFGDRDVVGQGEGVDVRPRQIEELPPCADVLRSVHASDGYPMCWPADPARWLTPRGLAAAWVVEHAGAITGHVGTVRDVTDPVVAAITGVPEDQLVSVTRLFVARQARGRGLGAILLDAVVRRARGQNLQVMIDVVDDGGAAVALYDRLGWRLVDRRLGDWTTPHGHGPPLRIYLAPTGTSAQP